MRNLLSRRRGAELLVAALVLLSGTHAAGAADTYVPGSGQLTIPVVSVGYATYTNLVVTIGAIVNGPTGTAPDDVADTYDPASGQLKVPAVQVGTSTYYNVVTTIAHVVSIGGATGVDSYAGGQLSVPWVQVRGGSLYANAVVTIDRVISIGGGPPTLATDSYDAATRRLVIPAVIDRLSNRIYTNVVAAVVNVVSIGPPGYTLTATPLYPASITSGSSAASTVSVTPANGYTGAVSLGCGPISGGMQAPTCAFNPPAATVGSITPVHSRLTVNTSIDTPGGVYRIPLVASDGKGAPPLNGSAALTLIAAATIQHVVIIFQENRTPDNLFQDPVLIARGADIVGSGMNSAGQVIPLAPIDLGTNGSIPQNYDLDHSHTAFNAMYDGGRMDGADRIACVPATNVVCPPNPQFRYVLPADVQPYFALAEQYTFGDRMFQTNQGPSFPAHQFIISGTSAPTATSVLFASGNTSQNLTLAAGCIAPPSVTVPMIDPTGSETSNPPQYPCFEHPTLTDLLDARGLSWRYYTPTPGSIWSAPDAIEHICQEQPVNGVLTCMGSIWTNHVVIPQRQVLADIANGHLAQVTWVIPDALESDHAKGNDGSGPAWVAALVNSIGNSAYWSSTAIIITWDDWGGWYDHVAPKIVNDGLSWGSGYVYGFRVPLIVVSPYAKAAHISHVTHDFGSVLKFVERTFSLPSLGYADVAADDLSDCFDLNQSPMNFRQIPAALSSASFMKDRHAPTGPDDD